MGSYLPHTEEERGEMLEAIGVHTIEECCSALAWTCRKA